MNFSWQKTLFIWGIIIGLCYHLGLPYVTLAHAELINSTPAPGEKLAASPEQIVLTFNEPIAASSTFVIYDRDFGVIPALVQTDINKPHIITGQNIEIVKSGVYTVQWLTTSKDGHSIDGSFSFAVDFENSIANNKGDKNNMELIALSESTAVNLPGWFAWIMVALAIGVPFLVLNLTHRK